MKTALEGVKVVDLTEWMYGSLGTRYLAEMGADVIKVEDLSGDPSRDLEAVRQRTQKALPTCKWNYYFDTNNRSKRGLAVDMNKQEGRNVLQRLVKSADVFATTYDDVKLKSLGLDYKSLSKANAKLIYAKASGWGKLGPDKDGPTLDVLTESRAGNMTRIGEPGEPPVYTGTGEPTTAIALAYAVIMALFHRLRTGEGQEVEASIFGGNIMFENYNLEVYLGTKAGTLARQMSRKDVGNPLFNLYPTKDKWVYMCMMQTDRWWPNLAKAMGKPELAKDPRFSSHAKITGESRSDVIQTLDKVLSTKPADVWFSDEVRKEIELIVTPVNSYADVYDDPQAMENQYIVDFDHPEHGRLRMVGHPGQFSQTPATIKSPAPKLGEHNHAILSELGYSEKEIEGLRSRRSVL